MYEDLLEYLLWTRSIQSWDRCPGILDGELDKFIEQIKGSNPIWEINGSWEGFPLNPVYVSAPDLNEAIHIAKEDHKSYSHGRIYME